MRNHKWVLRIVFLLCSCGSTEFSTEQESIPTHKKPTIRVAHDHNSNDSIETEEDAGQRKPLTQTAIFPLRSATTIDPIDIVFAVDTSGSMADEKAAIERHMTDFVSQLEQVKDADFKIIMVGTNFEFPAADDAPLTLVDRNIASTNALKVLADLLEDDELPLRPDTKKHIIVISDDDSNRLSGADFKGILDTNAKTKNRTSMHGIVGLPSSRQTSFCTIDAVGQEYINLGQDPTYGGLVQDLCGSEWTELLDHFARDIIKTSYQTRFPIGHDVDTEKTLQVFVGEKPLDEDTYVYIRKSNEIEITDPAILTENKELKVVYIPK